LATITTNFDIPKVTLKTLSGTITGDLVDGVGKNLRSTVGRNSTNNKADVELIQRLLNAASTVIDPAVYSGKVDGIYGPKTASAIAAYQRIRVGAVDGAISPGRVTIRHLALDARWGSVQKELTIGGNEGIDLDIQPLPPGITQDAQELARAKRAFGLLDTVIAMARRAVRTLTASRTNDAAGIRALALVDKHFRSSSSIIRLTEMGKITLASRAIEIFQSVDYSATQKKLRIRTNGDFLGVHVLAVGPVTDYIAESEKGGYWIPDEKICLGPLMENLKTDTMFAAAVLHEIIHTIGAVPSGIASARQAPEGRPVMEDLYPSAPEYMTVSAYRKLEVPSPYELFAHEATAGTEELKKRHRSPHAQALLTSSPEIGPAGIVH
jgi:peptidoglycan hydrolase-like protein with peptidoglycan-binding domain